MKKTLTTLALVAAIGFAGVQAADARWGGGGHHGNGPGNCDGSFKGMNFTEEAQEARQEFLDATTDVREQLAEKRTAYRDLMRSEDVDKEQASLLWSEMFDLRAQLKEKSAETGFTPGFARRGGGLGAGGGGGYFCDGPDGVRGGGHGPGHRWNR
ncbi:MAG: hypothetical protein KAI75_06725 [Desulfobulbaceae bacterium]|nr:hypothetical protein [Desulfobulbaceae bacterium]MCK5404906.1 hypothetical protein [Desulfobulbaceae bacterium]